MGDRGEVWFAAHLPLGWVWQPPRRDLGKDGVVVVRDGSDLHNLEFSIQIKTTERPKEQHGWVVKSGVPRSSVIYWFASPLPTLVVIVDIARDQAWYQWHLDLFESPRAVFQSNDKTLTIRIPVGNRLDEHGWTTIQNGLRKHFRSLEELIRSQEFRRQLDPILHALVVQVSNLHKLSRTPPPTGTEEVATGDIVLLVLEQFEHRKVLATVRSLLDNVRQGTSAARHIEAWTTAYEATAIEAFPNLLKMPELGASWDEAVSRKSPEVEVPFSPTLVPHARHHLLQAGLDMLALLTAPQREMPQDLDASDGRDSVPVNARHGLAELKASSHEPHKRREVTGALVTVSDLGFPDGATTAEVIGTEHDRDKDGHLVPFSRGRGAVLGMQLCSVEEALTFASGHTDQPVGERLRIAMRPSIGEDGEPGVLVLESRSDGLSLDGVRARPDDHWPATDVVLFIIPDQ